MPTPVDKGIRISYWTCSSPTAKERLDILQRVEKLNDGSACFVECDANDASIFYLRKRTLKDWWHESRAEFWAEFGFVKELNELKAARVAAMQVLASALGVSLDGGLRQRIREAAHGASFHLLDVSRVIAPETLDLSGKSFLISGFEQFDERHKLRRKHELDRLVKDGRQPLRVDWLCDAQGNGHLYVRPRSVQEAFQEFWMSKSARQTIENEAREAIESAFKPYLNELKGANAAPSQSQGVRPNKASPGQQVIDSDNASAWVEGLKRAVSSDRQPVEETGGNTGSKSLASCHPESPIGEESHCESQWINTVVMDPEGGKVSRVNLLEVIDEGNCAEFLESLKALLHNTTRPLRLKSAEDEHGNTALYLQERSLSDFFQEQIFGTILQQQCSDMKRDTACRIENKLSEVIGLLGKEKIQSRYPLNIDVADVEDLLACLRARVREDNKVQRTSSPSPLSQEESGTPASSCLDIPALDGLRHAPLVGCFVVQAHPLSFAADNIILPLNEVKTMRTYGDRVLEEGRAVAEAAEKEYREQISELEKKSRSAKDVRDTPQENSARMQAKGNAEAKRQGQRGGVPFPQDVQSIRHTPNLLLVPSLGALVGKEIGEPDWHAYYSALLNTSQKNSSLPGEPPPDTLKGTVVIAPQPDQEPNCFSEANLRGLVRACRERSSVEYAKKHGAELLAITIAHPDKEVAERISTLLDPSCRTRGNRRSAAIGDTAAGQREQASVACVDEGIEQFDSESDDDTFDDEMARHLACPSIFASPANAESLPRTGTHRDDDEMGPGSRLSSF